MCSYMYLEIAMNIYGPWWELKSAPILTSIPTTSPFPISYADLNLRAYVHVYAKNSINK